MYHLRVQYISIRTREESALVQVEPLDKFSLTLFSNISVLKKNGNM